MHRVRSYESLTLRLKVRQYQSQWFFILSLPSLYMEVNSLIKTINAVIYTICLEFGTLLQFRVLIKLQMGLSPPTVFPNEAFRHSLY